MNDEKQSSSSTTDRNGTAFSLSLNMLRNGKLSLSPTLTNVAFHAGKGKFCANERYASKIWIPALSS